jgi:hypothetical protein
MTTRDRIANVIVGCSLIAIAGALAGAVWVYDKAKRVKFFATELEHE